MKNRDTREPFLAKLELSNAIHEAALAAEPGIMLYPGQGCADGWSGDHFLISPPYTITKSEIDIIVEQTAKAIDDAIAAAQKAVSEQ